MSEKDNQIPPNEELVDRLVNELKSSCVVGDENSDSPNPGSSSKNPEEPEESSEHPEEEVESIADDYIDEVALKDKELTYSDEDREMKLSLALVLLTGACGTTLGALPEPIDLGYGYDSDTLMWPGGEKFNYRRVSAGENPSGVFLASNDFATAEHSGTHLDAPYHFNKEGRKVSEIPLDRLITKAVLVDAAKETGNNDSYVLPAEKLDEWVKLNGEIPEKSVLLVKFGWSSRYPNREEYMGPSDTDLRFPAISEEAGKWIVDSKKFVGVGVDTASLDDPKNQLFPVHQLVMGSDLYAMENLNLNHDLPPTFDLIVMPIKLVNGTGGPARVIAH